MAAWQAAQAHPHFCNMYVGVCVGGCHLLSCSSHCQLWYPACVQLRRIILLKGLIMRGTEPQAALRSLGHDMPPNICCQHHHLQPTPSFPNVGCGTHPPPAGMAYILLFSKWVLPGDDTGDDLNSALFIPQGSRAAGRTARASGLYGGKLQLTALSRNHNPAVPFSPDVELQPQDVVYVTG